MQEHDFLIDIIHLSSSDTEDIPLNAEKVDNNGNLEVSNEFENERVINTEDIGNE